MKSLMQTKLLQLLVTMPFIVVFCTVFAYCDDVPNGIVTAKYFWFYCSMAFVAMFIPFYHPVIQYNIADIFVYLFVLSIALTSLFSDIPIHDTKMIFLVLLFVLYILLRRLLANFDKAEKVLLACLVTSSLVECIIGLRQLYGLEASHHIVFKMTGTFFNPGPYSGYICMIFPLALDQLIQFSHIELRQRRVLTNYLKSLRFDSLINKSCFWLDYLNGLLSLSTVIASVLIITTTMSRASWLGFFLGGIFILYRHYPIISIIERYFKNKYIKYFAIILFAIILIGAIIGLYNFKKESADGRILIWKCCIESIVKNPLGVGVGNFGGAIGKAQSNYFESGQASQAEINVADVPRYAFNEYLQVCIESGAHTLLLLLLLIVLSIRNAIKNNRINVLGSLIAILVFAFFSYPFSVLPFLIVLTFILALCNTKIKINSSFLVNRKNYEFLLTCFKGVESAFCFGIILYCLINRYPTLKSYKEWNACKSFISAGMYEEALPVLKNSSNLLNDNIDFLYDYAYVLSKSDKFMESNLILKRAMQISCDPMLYNISGKNYQAIKEYSKAESCFVEAYNHNPNRIYPLYLLALLYFEQGDNFKAVKTANIVFNHQIIVPSLAIKEMKCKLRIMCKTVTIE